MDNPTSNALKRSALIRILQATAKLPVQITLYTSALGVIALIPQSEDLIALGVNVDDRGVNTLRIIIERLIFGDSISDEEICQKVQVAITESNIADLLTSTKFQAVIAKLVRNEQILENAVINGQHDIADSLARQYKSYEIMTSELKAPIAVVQEQLKLIQSGLAKRFSSSLLYRFRIFLSSPGDVSDERSIARNVIREVSDDPFIRDRVIIETIAWDAPSSRTPMLAALTPQEAIDLGLPKPSECDIVVVIFWSRMGTPLDTKKYPPKPNGIPYLSGTEWEYENALRASLETKRPDILVYRHTGKVLLDLDDIEFDEKRTQYERVKTFFKSFQNPDGSWKQSYSVYKSPDEFRRLLESDLKILIRRLLANIELQIPTLIPPTVPLTINSVSKPEWRVSPFRGLKRFDIIHAEIFCGRGRETDELIEKLRNQAARFVAITGASGCGKSSLILAGLLPRLKANAIEGSKDWIVIRVTPDELGSGNPFASLAAALIRDLANLSEVRLATQLYEEPTRLKEILEKILLNEREWTKILLFIDQFEELFTLINEDYLEPFINALNYMVGSERLCIITTIRADFYAQCMKWPQIAKLLRDGTYPLSTPDRGQLYDMITRPAERAGVTFEGQLVWDILEDTGIEPGSLALLSYTLDELYHMAKHDKNLTLSAYQDLRGVGGAIGTRAQLIFDSLDADAKASLPFVFQELVTVRVEGTPTRKRSTLSQVTRSDAAKRLVDILTKERLLVQGSGLNGQPIVEVAHEALFYNWPKLRDWIAETKGDLYLLEQVRQSAQVWKQNSFSAAFLWPDERLKPVYQMIGRLEPELNIVEKEFIRPELEWLLDELENSHTSHVRRNQIGDRLYIIGDTRAGIGITDHGLPHIIWCSVPGGTLNLSGANNDMEKFSISPFYIAKYPITYSQFQVFVEAEDGYKQPIWWDGLARRYEFPEEQRYKYANYPRETVNWYEAVAYSRWLTLKFKEIGLKITLYNSDWEIRLPTEWEWQQAATGGNPENIYPWGSEWNPNYANTIESGLGRPLAVGMFPQNKSYLVNASDMSGGIWEWCLNKYQDMRATELSGKATRVFRGGSFTRDAVAAQTTFRFHSDPLSRRYDLGFRLALVFSLT